MPLLGLVLGLVLGLASCAPKAPPAPSLPVRAGLVEVTGVRGRPPARQQLLLGLSTAAVTPCYEAALARDAGLYGEIVVRFSVDEHGAVPEALVHLSTLGDPAADVCVLDAVKALKFTDVESTSVLYPFVFTSDATPPVAARALKVKYGLLASEPEGDPSKPGEQSPPGVIYLW